MVFWENVSFIIRQTPSIMKLLRLTGALCLLTSLSLQAQNSSPYWSLTGNSNASSSSKLGTTNAIPLRLFTNNAERLRIDPTGKVGIGTTTLPGKLTLFNNGSTPAPNWVNTGFPIFVGFSEATGGNGDFILAMASNTRTTRPNFIGRRARGTLAAPLAVVNNDFLSSLQASGYDGSSFQNPANIDFFVDGTPSPGNVPARISFTTGSNLSNRVERVKIGSTGNITFNTNQLYLDNASGNVGIGTITPAQKLHVEGKGVFSGGLTLVDSGMTISTKEGPALKILESYSPGPSIEINNPSGSGIKIVESGADAGIEVNNSSSTGIKINSSGDGIIINSHSMAIRAFGNDAGIYSTVNPQYSGYAVYGEGPVAIYGYGQGSESRGTGVYGEGVYGVYGYSTGDFNVNSDGTNSYGVYGYNESIGSGVKGLSQGPGVYGGSSNSYGVYGTTANASSYAGYFNGKVNATGGYYTISDSKFKQNITTITSAMDVINKLQPKSYEYKQEGSYKEMNLPKGKHFGLVAQEVEKVLPDLVHESQFNTQLAQLPAPVKPGTKQVTKDSTQKTAEKIDFKAVNYLELIPIMVKAMQEQQQQIEILLAKNKVLEEKIQTLETSQLNRSGHNDLMVNISSAYLEQSIPNPTGSAAIIRYFIPQGSSTAQLLLTNIKGQILKQVALNGKGPGQVTLNVATLTAGTYTYSLWVDGAQTDSRKLVVAR
jgi:hypothetical protein